MQIVSGRQLADWIRHAFIAMMVLCVFAWSVAPSFTHSANYLLSVSERSQIMGDHGHSHGEALDNYWALHGHSHDAVDHDHSSAILFLVAEAESVVRFRLPDALEPFLDKPDPIYRLDRPPRV